MARGSRDPRDDRFASRSEAESRRINRQGGQASSGRRHELSGERDRSRLQNRTSSERAAARISRDAAKRTRVSAFENEAPFRDDQTATRQQRQNRPKASSRANRGDSYTPRSNGVSRQTSKGGDRAKERMSSRSALPLDVRSSRGGNERTAQNRRSAERSTQRTKSDQFFASNGIPVDLLKDPTRSQKAQKDAPSRVRALASHFGAACAWVWSKSKIAALALAVVLVLGVAGGIDALANMNRIYQGVSVGNIDLSGKTIDEATALISQEYEPRINNNDVVLCASEEVAQQAQSDREKRDTLEEQISYEESLAHRDRWTIDAQVLGATFDPATYAQEAYQVGREDGGFFRRLNAQFSGVDIKPECTFNATSLDELREEIITALGTKMVDFNVEMKEGSAHVTDGHDGYEVSEEWLVEKLNDGLLHADGESRFVIDMHDVTVRIDREGAQLCATQIDNSIAPGITFQYEGKQWYADRAQLAQWIATEVREEGAGYTLKPLFDDSRANQAIIKGFGFSYGGSDHTVQFSNQDDQIVVTTNATGTVPQVSGAIENLNNTFFSTNERSSAPLIEISAVEVPDTMSFEEACDYGLVVKISSFTTQYASGAEARNNNIHVAADALDDSICKAGETWSFLALSGETTPDKGYQDAGAIIGGEYSDAIGGGICQVATTVFNAVYDAGYPIERRYNHSLYIASYPEGRDAAIAYPDMDLIWRNDTESDVLLVMSYTNSSVTATLYGVDPGYEVTTRYGEWQEGEPYRTIVRQDSDYPVGEEFVESSGADGRSITIVRTVKDRNGNIVQEKEFQSNYHPKNKVVVQGSAQPSTSE